MSKVNEEFSCKIVFFYAISLNNNVFDRKGYALNFVSLSFDKELSKIAPPVIDKKKISFTSEKNETLILEERNIINKSFIKKIQEEYPNNLFIENMIKQMTSLFVKWKMEVQTNPIIRIPGFVALGAIARKYYEKYEIEIYIKDIDDLRLFICEYAKATKEPCYIGIITGKEISRPANHVTPLLCYFNGNGSHSELEVAILDSVGGMQIFSVYRILKDLNDSIKIWTEGTIRQADASSCRTDSVILLRNALLSIKHNKIINGLSLIFEQCISNSSLLRDQKQLPSQWNYSAQIHKMIEEDESVVIRHLYSKKTEKHTKIETVNQYRNRNKKISSVIYDFSVYGINKSVFKDLNPPSTVIDYQIGSQYSYFRIPVNVSLNDYLVRKSAKWFVQLLNN